ncbi:serine-rich adhesin for platelets [Stegostoma tigrinum]|uniref:serine-rich adhesin for platelets n=1 Tax=Stegostoma tigrinum TaxID=3053191 RepID=UPI00202B8070|nr:serine-rich adhesin for platelets [Stegostoma tigrinum]
MSQSRPRESSLPVVDSSGRAWALSSDFFTQSNPGLWPLLTSTGTVGPMKINMNQEDVDTISDADTHLVITSEGEPNSLPKISGDIEMGILPRTVQKSTNQSAGRMTTPLGTESEVSLVPISIPGDDVSHHAQRSRQRDRSSEHRLALSAGYEVDLVTQPQLQDKVEVSVTLTPAREVSTRLSVLQGVVEMSLGSGSVSRVERSSTASDTAHSESQDRNSLPSIPARPGELITPQPDQSRKQESESDQHTLSFSQPTHVPTSELFATQNINTQNLVNSLKIDSVAESVNQLETTHWTLDFKGSSSDFDGSITPIFSQVMIKPTSRAWNMFEIPELMTHSSNLPVQEVANVAKTDTVAVSSEPGLRESLPEIISADSSLNGAVTTLSARPWSPLTNDDDLTSTNRFSRSISFTPDLSLTAVSVVASGGEMASSEVTDNSGSVRGKESKTQSSRDTTVEDDRNVTQFTFSKDRMAKGSANHSQRLEVTQSAESSTGFWVTYGTSVAKKDSGRRNTARDSATERLVSTKPSDQILWFEGGTILPPNFAGESTGGSPTGHNVVSGDTVPLFSPRTPAPELITSPTVVNISSPFFGVDHSASPTKETFPTTLSLSEFPEQSSTSFEESLLLTRVRETITPTLSNTTLSRSGNAVSPSQSKIEPQTSAGERLRETSVTAMNQTFQEVTVLDKLVVTSGTPVSVQGSWSETQLDSQATTPPSFPVLTSSVISVTNVKYLLPSVSAFEAASQPSSDQTGTGLSHALSSPLAISGVSDQGEAVWQNTVSSKFTAPSPPALPFAAGKEETVATGEGSPSFWAAQMHQSGLEPVDGSPGPNVTRTDTKGLNRDAAQTVKPLGNKRWPKKILSTLAAVHTVVTEGFWTRGWSGLGTPSVSHGLAPTLGSSAPPVGTTSFRAVTMKPRSVTRHKHPVTLTPGSGNSWTSGRNGPSLISPTLRIGQSMSPVPTSEAPHLPVDTTLSERPVQTVTQHRTLGTLGEMSKSAPSFNPTERRKNIFIVENELPTIKEGVTLNIPTKLILDMNFTHQLGDPASDEYQNLAKHFTHKVSPFYKKVPGFQQLLIKHFRAGSVLIEFDVVFIAKEIQGYLLDLSLILNITGLNDVIADGFEIDGAQVLSIYVSDDPIALCGQVFSCPTGFQCIHRDRRNVSCTSLCHTDYCKSSGICTHSQGQEPICQCPVGIDYWFMGPRCDHRMTRQSLIGIVFGVILSLLLVTTAVAIIVLRRFKILLIEAKIDQTKSSYKRFSQFDDFSSQYQSQSWLNYSVSSLNNPGFSNSDELIHLQMLDSSYHSCHEEFLTGTCSSWRTTPCGHSTYRHSLQNNLDVSISSINEHAGDSGKASDLSVYSWPTDPLQWSPFPILYQLSRDRPFTARRPRSYCEGMELVSLEKNWTA